jgi:hypothetical protein
MAPKSDELREDIAETRARIDQDIDTLQTKFKRSTNPQVLAEENPTPLLLVAIGVGLLLAFLFFRRGRNEPPRPARGSRKARLAELLDEAEEEEILSDEARRVLISLLTVQGLKWLREYMEKEVAKSASEVMDRAEQSVDTLAERIETMQEATAARAGEAAQTATTATRDFADQVAQKVAATTNALSEQARQQADAVVRAAGEGREEASSLVEQAKERARGTAQLAGERSGELADSSDDALTKLAVETEEARLKAQEALGMAEAHAEAAARGSASKAGSWIHRITGRG